MFKIKPLNFDSSSEEETPQVIRKEAQEENALSKYNKALKLQVEKNYDEAQTLLKSLLEEDIPGIEQKGGLPKTMSTFKYSCHLNLGHIFVNLDEKQKALDNYLTASEMDKTDVMLWYKIGSLSLELDHFKQAAVAYNKGLECNKNHWPTLDKLIMLLYGMRDMVSCLCYISHALQLDQNYTRGLMLRKRIYERNPATEEYYQLFNSDYIYDPPLTTEFDEIEGKELEEESLVIDRRIREIELKFEWKPPPIITFQKPIESLTWLSLGESIVHMHKHMTENRISYLNEIDLVKSFKTKCDLDKTEKDISVCHDTTNKTNTTFEDMFKNEKDVSEVEDSELEENGKMDVENEKSLEKNEHEKHEVASSQEEEESDCQKSEHANQETKENDFNLDGTMDKSTDHDKSRRPPKRRRNSLSFLQPWGWHSKRKSSRKFGKNEKDDSIEGVLRRTIPSNILPNGLKCDRYKQSNSMHPDDSLSCSELYKMYNEENESSSESNVKPDISKITQNYFGTPQEREDVEGFINFKFECCDIMFILQKFVSDLATKWELKWPEKLKLIFIEAYEMFREHCDHPPLFSTEFEFSELRIDALITLFYGELLFDATLNNLVKNRFFSCQSMSNLELLCSRKTDWGSEYLKYCLRLHWLRANIFMNENKSELAIRSLNNIIYFIKNYSEDQEKYFLYLPNFSNNQFVTLSMAEKNLRSFEMIQNLNQVESYYEDGNYQKVIEILKETFNHKNVTSYKIKNDRPVQIFMLLHSFWILDRWECLRWSEICLNESIRFYLKTCITPDSKEHKRWGMVVVKCLTMMEACIKEETVIVVDCLKTEQTRLVENFATIICHQINSKSIDTDNKLPLETVKPWILLHYILQREEHRIQASGLNVSKRSDDSDDENNENNKSFISQPVMVETESEIPPSIEILFHGHDFLGKRSWCLDSNGELLLFIVDTVLYRLDCPIFMRCREKIENHLEQTFFCLFQHPSKKNKVSRHLADHNVNPLSLTWDHAKHLYEFYQPKVLPEFDSYKNISISNEMEQLLLRILALVPSEHDPQKLVDRVNEFLNGQSKSMPEPLAFPYKLIDIYYLLGDYYLKLHDPVKSMKYFISDLCINPGRLDTWADMALGLASQLETKLNHCEAFKNDVEFLDKAKTAQICFKQSLQISEGHATLWIEYGNFVYMSHSYCSRLLKGDTEMFSMEKFETLESQKENMLDIANECFSAANMAWLADENEHDERWLHHYMLGKIAEKRRQEPTAFLEHYHKAGKFLFENKATYPLKINISTPPHLSMEALEIHYRIHAAILKYLELHEDKPLPRATGKIFQKYLKEANNGLFSNPTVSEKIETKDDGSKRLLTDTEPNSDNATKKRKLSDLTIFEDVATVVEDMLKALEAEVEVKPSSTEDEIMIIDSDEEVNIASKLLQLYQELSKKSQIKEEKVDVPEKSDSTTLVAKNAQDIMDDMMKKCMENQLDYKTEMETDTENEAEKNKETKGIDKAQKITETPSSPSRRGSTTSTAATTTTTTTSDSSTSSSSDESSDSSSSSDSESSETASSNGKNKKEEEFLSQPELKILIDQCINSLEQCASRFPQNYKALYRLTHFYLNNKTYKDLNKCRQLMLTEYTCKDSTVLTGLFSDRKQTNFFNGIWRIPTSEIDRPGSFAAHMSRCVQLLMQVLREMDDHKILLDLFLTLKKTPDPDKIYIRDAERVQLSDQALSLCIQCLRGLMKRMTTGTTIYLTELVPADKDIDPQIRLVMDMYRAYMKVLSQKNLPQKESVFSSMFTDAYKFYMQNKLPENVNVLDLAIKFCQQWKAAHRLAQIQGTNPALIKPVMPSIPAPVQAIPAQPSTPPSTVPVKKPPKPKDTNNPSRPRGRPPIASKTTSSSSTSSKSSKMSKDPFLQQYWLTQAMSSGKMDPNTALNMMMSTYQEQLLRQYAMGSSNPLLTNPFAVKNPLIPTSSQSTTFGKDVGKTGSLPKPEKSRGKDETKVRYSKESGKSYVPEPPKSFGGGIDMFKDRPGISITPVQSGGLNPFPPNLPSSPTKTLQQKLAERQKQAIPKPKSKPETSVDIINQLQSLAQKQISFPKPSQSLQVTSQNSLKTSQSLPSQNALKNLQKTMPSSLTITKSQSQLSPVLPNFPDSSSISISQISPSNLSSSFRKPNLPASTKSSKSVISKSPLTFGAGLETKVDFPQKLPLSLSITKTDGKSDKSKRDGVEVIEIE